jgi:hypothetical protein
MKPSEYSHLEHELSLAGPPDPAQVDFVRRHLGTQAPDDYLAFMTAHDGAEGAVGRIYPALEVARAEDFHPELDHLHGLVMFGDSGGGEVFAFDIGGTVVIIPWIGSARDAIPQGTFTQFLERLVQGRLFDRE